MSEAELRTVYYRTQKERPMQDIGIEQLTTHRLRGAVFRLAMPLVLSLGFVALVPLDVRASERQCHCYQGFDFIRVEGQDALDCETLRGSPLPSYVVHCLGQEDGAAWISVREYRRFGDRHEMVRDMSLAGPERQLAEYAVYIRDEAGKERVEAKLRNHLRSNTREYQISYGDGAGKRSYSVEFENPDTPAPPGQAGRTTYLPLNYQGQLSTLRLKGEGNNRYSVRIRSYKGERTQELVIRGSAGVERTWNGQGQLGRNRVSGACAGLNTVALDLLDRLVKGIAIALNNDSSNELRSFAVGPEGGIRSCCPAHGGVDKDGDGRCDEEPDLFANRLWSRFNFGLTDQTALLFSAKRVDGGPIQCRAEADLDCDGDPEIVFERTFALAPDGSFDSTVSSMFVSNGAHACGASKALDTALVALSVRPEDTGVERESLDILLDGQRLGPANRTYQVAPGPHLIEVLGRGYYGRTMTDLSAGKSHEVAINPTCEMPLPGGHCGTPSLFVRAVELGAGWVEPPLLTSKDTASASMAGPWRFHQYWQSKGVLKQVDGTLLVSALETTRYELNFSWPATGGGKKHSKWNGGLQDGVLWGVLVDKPHVGFVLGQGRDRCLQGVLFHSPRGASVAGLEICPETSRPGARARSDWTLEYGVDMLASMISWMGMDIPAELQPAWARWVEARGSAPDVPENINGLQQIEGIPAVHGNTVKDPVATDGSDEVGEKLWWRACHHYIDLMMSTMSEAVTASDREFIRGGGPTICVNELSRKASDPDRSARCLLDLTAWGLDSLSGCISPSQDTEAAVIGTIQDADIGEAEALAVTVLAQFAAKGMAGIQAYLLTPQELASVDSVTHEKYVAKTRSMLELSVEKGTTQVALRKRTKRPRKGLEFDILQGKIGTYEFRLFKYQGQWKIYRS